MIMIKCFCKIVSKHSTHNHFVGSHFYQYKLIYTYETCQNWRLKVEHTFDLLQISSQGLFRWFVMHELVQLVYTK